MRRASRSSLGPACRSPGSSGQRHAYETLLERWSLRYRREALDPAEAFGRVAPLVLEIGFGMGEATAQIARKLPDMDFLGIEVYPAGVGSLLRRIEEGGLQNIRIVQHDAVEVVRAMLAPGSLAGIHVFFPDPWPKKRHHKRRLLQVEFARLLSSRLRPGGYLHVATDWDEYAEWILEVLGHTELENTAARYAPRPPYRPLTKFERRGLALGHAVHDIVFRRPA